MFILDIKKLEKNIQFYKEEFQSIFIIDETSILYVDCFGKIKKTSDFFINKFFFEKIFGQNKHFIWFLIKDIINEYTYNLDYSLRFIKNEYSNEKIFIPLMEINKKIRNSIIIYHKIIKNEKTDDKNNYLFLKEMETFICDTSIIFSIYEEKVNRK